MWRAMYRKFDNTDTCHFLTVSKTVFVSVILQYLIKLFKYLFSFLIGPKYSKNIIIGCHLT